MLKLSIRLFFIVMSLAAFTIATPTYARPAFLITAGLTFGGDKLAEVEVIDESDDLDTVDIDAGQLFYLAGGFIFNLPIENLSLQATIGWHIDGVTADNGDASFERFPLEAIPFYSFGSHRVGIGASYILSPELDLADAGQGKVQFKDTIGAIFQYNYTFSKTGLILGARYQLTEFELDNVTISSNKIDGNYFGLHFGYSF